MVAKKISWITAYYFLDVDLPIIAKLKDDYNIYWQITIGHNENIDYKNYVESLIPDCGENLEIVFVYEKYGRKDPRTFFSDFQLIRRAKSHKPDLYYISGFMYPWGLLLFKTMLPKNKVVMACHNVSTPKGATSSKRAEKNIRFVLRHFVNLQVFSKSQHAVLDSRCEEKNVLEAPLALKDYGKASISRRETDKEIVRFLNFGIIRDYKRVDLLIEAGNRLFERGYRDFRVLIAGNSNEWETKYTPMIKHPEVFEVQIRRIPNEDVANLFAISDYFVMPYQDIAQSGAITVAFRYNIPTIVSDIPQFREFVEDGKTGIMFKSGNAKALADCMQYVLDNHTSLHPQLKENQAKFVRDELSIESIIAKYKAYFDKL